MALLGGARFIPSTYAGRLLPRPSVAEWHAIVEELKGREAMVALVRWTGQLPFPAFEQEYEFVALRHPDEYPFNEGRLVSNRGLDIPIAAFEEFLIEEHVTHSTALHAYQGAGQLLRGTVAPQPNFDRLSPLARDAAR